MDEATLTIVSPFVQLTAIFDSSANGDPNTDGVFRVSLSLLDAIERYKDITIESLNKIYSSAEQLASANSFTFDDSASHAADSAHMGMSMVTETMDNDMFTRYLSDSAI